MLTDIQKNWLDKVVHGSYSFNYTTKSVDVTGNVTITKETNVIEKDSSGNVNSKSIRVQFGMIYGNFSIEEYKSHSNFDLEGGPHTVMGNFKMFDTNITSLKGGPKQVGGNFNIDCSLLKSLMYSPERVGGNFSCMWSRFKNLLGSSRQVDGSFDCSNSYTRFNSLEGCPENIQGNFKCSSSSLNTLKFMPSFIGGDFQCAFTHITTLDFKKDIVIDGDVYLTDNEITDAFGIWNINVSGKVRFNSNNDSVKDELNLYNKMNKMN